METGYTHTQNNHAPPGYSVIGYRYARPFELVLIDGAALCWVPSSDIEHQSDIKFIILLNVM
jgi:hypothetical protein